MIPYHSTSAQSDMIYLDFKKTFDCVAHNGLSSANKSTLEDNTESGRSLTNITNRTGLRTLP